MNAEDINNLASSEPRSEVTSNAHEVKEVQVNAVVKPTPKYRKKVEVTVSDINTELSKIMSAPATMKNIGAIEADLAKVGKKVNELKKALSSDKKEQNFAAPSTQKIAKNIDKLIDIANKYEFDDCDKEILIRELRKNLGEVSNFVSTLQKALAKTEHSDEFTFGG